MSSYNLVVTGGTFDHFHKGHREFLQFALSCSKKVVLGLTSDQYIQNRKQTTGIENYSQRKQALEKFLKTHKILDRVEIAPIDNLFIPKQWEELSIEAIIVSEDTKQGAEEINKKRTLPLKIVVAPNSLGVDGKVISSTRIRQGEINREGKPYVNTNWLDQTLQITEELTQKLKAPLGILIKDLKNFQFNAKQCVISVGDITTKMLNNVSIKSNISVVDFQVAREKTFSDFSELGFDGSEVVITVDNPAGHITPELFSVVKQSFVKAAEKKRIIIKVNGEEDLAVLPVVLISPLGSIVLYGQPSKGIVVVEVTEEQKEKAYNVVDQFKY